MEGYQCRKCLTVYKEQESNFYKKNEFEYNNLCSYCEALYQRERYWLLQGKEYIDPDVPISEQEAEHYSNVATSLNLKMTFKPRFQSWSTIKTNNINLFKNLDK